MSAKQLVDSAVDENFITIFSKSYCPYCKAAKATINDLKLNGKTVKIYELDEREDGGAIQEYLYTKTNQRTVPNIFINKQHIGGNDNLQQQKKSGNLSKLIQ